MHVAVVRELAFPRVVPDQRPSVDSGSKEIAESIAEELHDAGHTTMVCEGDETLLRVLRDFMPRRSACATGMVFNLVRRGPGEGQPTQVPAMLEMAGITYTGPTPVGHAITLDRVAVHALLRQARIPTPDLCVSQHAGEVAPGLSLPLLVRARDVETAADSRLVRSRAGADVRIRPPVFPRRVGPPQ